MTKQEVLAPNLRELIDEAIRKVDMIKADLKKKIKSLPDNNQIARISDNCFVVRMSTIKDNGTILSPYFYDFRFQYKLICDLIDDATLTDFSLLRKLEQLMDTGHLTTKSGRYKFHPTVINYLKEFYAREVD